MSNYIAIIIHGPVGAGKTQICQTLVRWSKKEGVKVSGVLSPCIKSNGKVVGYDILDVKSGDIFPLVRLVASGEDWFSFKTLKYRFSMSGFQRVNGILSNIVDDELVIIDEYGRLERHGNGFSYGFTGLTNKLRSGVLVITCREDLVDHVRCQLKTEDILSFSVSDIDLIWKIIKKSLL